jgi:peptidoglycan/LPS O-acetylase OafA/YrhL
MAPLLMQVLRLRGAGVRRAVLVTAIVVITILQETGVHSAREVLMLPHFLQYFLTGILLADIYVLENHRIADVPLWDASGLIGLFFLFNLDDSVALSRMFLPLVITAIFVGALHGPLLRRVYRNPWITCTGGMCYSIYLTHLPVISEGAFVARNLVNVHWSLLTNYGVFLVLTGIPALLFALLFYLVVERPCMNPALAEALWRSSTGAERRVHGEQSEAACIPPVCGHAQDAHPLLAQE